MAELAMTKRPAMHAGEMGLFVDSPIFEDDFANVRTKVGLQVKVTQPHNLKQFRLAWVLAGKIAQSGVLGDADKEEAMAYLLKKVKHVKYIYNKHREGEELEVVVKSIRWAQLEQDAFNRIFNRMIYIVVSEILPEMPDGELRAEVEKMAGVETPEPTPVKTRQRRRTAEEIATAAEPRQQRAPKPVSVIPADDVPGDAGAQPPAPADAPAPPAPPPAAQVKAEPAPITEPPKDLATWKPYCLAWLGTLDDDPAATDVDVLARWSGETKLRNACGVTGEDRQPLFELMNAILEKKREAQAKRT